MTFTQDELAAVVGSLYLENIALRKELAKAEAELQKLREPKVQELKVANE